MLHGILNVYKEKGYTSHDVVARLRGITGQKKIGHTGTLDPEAEGVLPVCLGNATKVCSLLTDKDKCYRTVMLLGVSTDTQDLTGIVVKSMDTSRLSDEMVRKAILQFVGQYDQIPPMYSALKVNGKKLYELAREGKIVERKARTVQIYDIRILEIRLPRVEMEVSCSKGTYIRTLCQDIGESLGLGGCMESLLRVRAGEFCLENSVKLDKIEEAKMQGRIGELLVPTDRIFDQYREVHIDQNREKRLQNGNAIPAGEEADLLADQEYVRVYGTDGRFVAIYKYMKQKREYQVVKMFPQ